ncbi:C-C motif chemokine 7-like [Thunnus maccoyii]|uniref:C-C motif chemokine 7-like n=1 Tax=Thunnus maccoyii TaxID=8240 RepID=UPI001C4D2E2E|nr:C-C motif chemokine 7-like [Thunnus maccoyii]XP_042274970.1 C-C motif chemokine 7-like [Thunnus maccoyii]XP_042274976.1 C-C motif chemokine 7-like [Thunnus maccoyii]
MKTLAAFILLTLICFLHHSSAGPHRVGFMSEVGCCMNHTRKIIPKQRVKHVEETPSHCPTKAIVVTSVCDKKFCFDPDFRWAKRLLAVFENFPDKTSPPAPFNRSKCGKKK